MPHADKPNFVVGSVQKLENGHDQGLDRCSRSLLDEYVAVPSMSEGEEDQFYGIVEGHHETCHARIRDGDGLVSQNLAYEEWDDRSSRCHDVAIAGPANQRGATIELARRCYHHFFHHRLADAHGV